MNPEIIRDGPVEPREIEDLRQAVGWDRSEGTYDKILPKHYAHYTVRDADRRLVGYMSVLSDGVADAFLLDLAVHPQCQKRGMGTRIVRRAIQDLKDAGIRCVQVTFTDPLEPFYAQCGFHIFKGGIIDFKVSEMNSEIGRNLGEQPVARIMREHGLKAHDLVAVSTEQITHKMVSRACKGRRLTPNIQAKIRNALVKATGRQYSMEELFTY